MKNKNLKMRLRSLRNKIIYNGDVPLEKDCLIWFEKPNNDFIQTHIIGLYKIVQKEYHDRAKRFELFLIENTVQLDNHKLRTIQSKEIEQLKELNLIEILGKPVTLQEVLLMIEKLDYAKYTRGTSTSLYIYNDHISQDFCCEIDLTKQIEEQDEEVLEKLLEIIV